MENSQQQFFELVRAGLFPERGARILAHGVPVDWAEIYRLAEEQSVVGLIAAGIESLPPIERPPQQVVLQFVGSTLQIEQRNRAMNAFVEKLISLVRQNDIYALLVKGQGIAQCYEKPMWRASGDVDLLLSDNNYQKAAEYLKAVSASVDEENVYNKHLAMTIDGWSVELHGTLRSGLWRSLDRELDRVQEEVFCGGKVRSWMNGDTQVFLPAADGDVMFVFSHILQHFYKEGIGLRQICDWCRLLYCYREKLDLQLLESRIRRARVMSEWKAFAALAVEYLGMPVEAMPLFNDNDNANEKLKRKAARVMEFVLETGNFGHNRDYSYQKKYPYVVMKAISLWKHIKDFGRYCVIFPVDAIKVTWRRMCVGFSVAIRGKRHE